MAPPSGRRLSCVRCPSATARVPRIRTSWRYGSSQRMSFHIFTRCPWRLGRWKTKVLWQWTRQTIQKKICRWCRAIILKEYVANMIPENLQVCIPQQTQKLLRKHQFQMQIVVARSPEELCWTWGLFGFYTHREVPVNELLLGRSEIANQNDSSPVIYSSLSLCYIRILLTITCSTPMYAREPSKHHISQASNFLTLGYYGSMCASASWTTLCTAPPECWCVHLRCWKIFLSTSPSPQAVNMWMGKAVTLFMPTYLAV